MKKAPIKSAESLIALQGFTAARIAIGRAGTSIPLKQSLEFKLAHAHARDAVYSELNIDAIEESLNNLSCLFCNCTARRDTANNTCNGRIWGES